MNYAEIKKTYYSKLEEESTSSFPGFEAWMESCSTLEESLEVFQTAIQNNYPNNHEKEKVGKINCVHLREKPLSFLKIAFNKASTMGDFEQLWKDFYNFGCPDSFNKVDKSADEINYITLCSKTLPYTKTTEDVLSFWRSHDVSGEPAPDEAQLMILTKFLSLAETSEEIWKFCEYMVSDAGSMEPWMKEIKLCFRRAFEIEDKE